nr:augmin subunit 5 [Quercus suber]
MGANGSTRYEAVAPAEKNAALLPARVGSLDLSTIPSIFRVSAALQYPVVLTMLITIVEDIECSDIIDVIAELNLLSASKEGHGKLVGHGRIRVPTAFLLQNKRVKRITSNTDLLPLLPPTLIYFFLSR